MNHLLHAILAALFCLLLFSCSTPTDSGLGDSGMPADKSLADDEFQDALYRYYLAWRDTPYREGGMGREGIDCSGLVHIAFLDLKNIRLPRTVQALRKTGRTVSKAALLPGDLLFFDTGFFSEHVGIHIEKGRFLHASSSRGVTISSLENTYWRRRFETAKRIDIPRSQDV